MSPTKKSTKQTINNEEITSVTRTITPADGSHNLLAAWRGIYHLFGGRVEKWEVTNNEVTAVGLTISPEYDLDQVLSCLNTHNGKAVNKRLEFFPAYNYVTGETPEPFSSPAEMTIYGAQFFRGSEVEGRSPEFVKKAIASYKKTNNFPARKRGGGRPKRTIKIQELGSLDASMLKDVDKDALNKLKETLLEVEKLQAEANVVSS